MKILITGMAGFIGFHLAMRLVKKDIEIVGLDIINDYYDIRVKYGRLAQLGLNVPQDAAEHGKGFQKITSSIHPNLSFVRIDLTDSEGIKALFKKELFDTVVNLAAQAGVRYSLTNPDVYIASNIQGFLNILEAARAFPVKHLVYASSSSVYGINTIQPFSETGAADHPASLYAVSKRCNELMAHSYSHLYGIPTTGLRFFTVYGPWGRPDMALFLFTKAILEGKPIDVFNYGNMQRDFTYVDDIVEGITRIMSCIPRGCPDWDGIRSGQGPAPARVYNIGNGAPVRLLDFIHALEEELGMEAKKNMLPIQPGDVPATWADCNALEQDTGYRPQTSIREGIKHFVTWYKSFYLNKE
ncbi:NAD-dependent epimerase [Treponema primitia]|uniref:NAD-dependent epimerase n=1 Tax=Treponema primitia TaxID=88058 RepID=UPI000255569F|nr:NAD-dependent epimerase [Treponema primitia]